MEAKVHEGSRAFMRGVRKAKPEPVLSELQERILEELSDGQMHSLWALAERLDVATGKFRSELDDLSLIRPVYEESKGRRCSIGILTEACFE